jgi:hypothetical protein
MRSGDIKHILYDSVQMVFNTLERLSSDDKKIQRQKKWAWQFCQTHSFVLRLLSPLPHR